MNQALELPSPKSVTPQLIEARRKSFITEVAGLPDLTETEQASVVEMCVAVYRNNGWGPVQAGITGLANLVRSRRGTL
jgi:hypothetical protein